MAIIELLVGLKIPDTTAITTFHKMKELGYKITKLSRLVYYKFDVGCEIEKFQKKIVNTDILVNSNKNTSKTLSGMNIPKSVLIQSIENDCDGILETLKKLGFDSIRSMSQGILWTFDASEEEIQKATEDLLYNKHYQKVRYT